MTIRVLAVADSDSYLKWACATLDRLGPADESGLDRSAVIVKTPIAPTTSQIAAAVAGSSVVRPAVLPVRELAAHVRTHSPDVVLIAATGPVAEVVARAIVGATGKRRPALITGLPGMALPATPEGTGWRRWCDAFVVHSRLEVDAYREAFAGHGVAPEVPLAHLPFLEHMAASLGTEPVKRVVFAAQAKVPDNRPDRVALLDRLARLADDEFEVIVKLRARKGERQTHNEAFPYDELWDTEHGQLGYRSDALRFVDGPMAEWLQPGTALMTVSSTAAMESLALGLSTVIIDDFGVSDVRGQRLRHAGDRGRGGPARGWSGARPGLARGQLPARGRVGAAVDGPGPRGTPCRGDADHADRGQAVAQDPLPADGAADVPAEVRVRHDPVDDPPGPAPVPGQEGLTSERAPRGRTVAR